MQTEVQAQAAPAPNSIGPNSSDTTLAILAIVLPVILVVSVVGYRRWRNVRLRQQIESLERIWQLSYRKTKS